MNQTGVCGTGSPRAARRKAESCSARRWRSGGHGPIFAGQAASRVIGDRDAPAYLSDMAAPRDAPRIEPPRPRRSSGAPSRQMRAAQFRPELFVEEMPAPQRIAPFASRPVGRRDRRRRRRRLRPDRGAARPGRQRRLGRHLPLRRLRPRRDRPRAGQRPDAGRRRLELADRGARGPRRRVRRALRQRHLRQLGELRRDGRRAADRPARDPGLVVAPVGDLDRRTSRRGASCCAPPSGCRPCPRASPTMPQPARTTRPGLMARTDADLPDADDPRPGRDRRGAGPAALRCSTLRDGAARRSPRPRPQLADVSSAASPPAPARSRIDAERASGYRYSPRAYLIQLRREGSGTALVDPIAFDDLDRPRRRPSATPSGSCTPPARTSPACARSGCVPPGSSTPSSPRGCSATRASAWPPGRGDPRASRCARSTPPSTGRRDRCREPWLEYAALDVEVLRRAARGDRRPSSTSPARTSGPARSSST